MHKRHTRQPVWAMTILGDPSPARWAPARWAADLIEDYHMRNDDLAPIPCPRPGHGVDHGLGGVRETAGSNVASALAQGTTPGPEDCESAPIPARIAGAPGVLNQEC
ncbi:hypothetical protein GCM10009696_18520 [Kocuria himachalensis]